MARRVAKRIRSARKMFKLLKFIDEYKTFQKGMSNFSAGNLGSAMKSLVVERKVSENLSVFENLF